MTRGPVLASRRGRPGILVVRRRYLGDTVLVQPLLRNLREHWPTARITLAVDTPYVEILASCPEVDEIVEIPVAPLGVGAQIMRWMRAVRTVASHAPYDLALDLAHNERSQVLLLVSRAPRRATIAVDRRIRRERLYTDVLHMTRPEVDSVHTVDLNNRLLETLGVPTPFRVPAVPVPEGERAAAEEMLAAVSAQPQNGRPVLLVHPGSSVAPRRWPTERFAYVADRAAGEVGARIVVLHGPGEQNLARAIADSMRAPAAVLSGPPSVPRLLGLLAQADMLLCNDSGPMHMAAAASTPVCALFGSQSLKRWAPLGTAGHLTFQADLPCGDRCVATQECDPTDPVRSYCVHRIAPEAVADALTGRLARSSIADPPGGRS